VARGLKKQQEPKKEKKKNPAGKCDGYKGMLHASELPFLLPVVLQAPGLKIYICTMAK